MANVYTPNRRGGQQPRAPASTGTLRVRVLKATNIIDADTKGKPDPFVTVAVGEQRKQTSYKEGTNNPQWNEIFLFTVKTQATQMGITAMEPLIIEVWDKDTISKDSLGSGVLDISDLAMGNPKDVTVNLKKDGKLFVRIEAVDFGLHNAQASHAAHSWGAAMPPAPASGTLRVKVEKATGLRDTDLAGRADPFVSVIVGDVKKITAVKEGTLNPVWNQTLIFPVKLRQTPQGAVCNERLVVEVFDKDVLGKEGLGRASLDLADLPQSAPQEVALPLEGDGKLYLTLEALDFGVSDTPVTAPAAPPAHAPPSPRHGSPARAPPPSLASPPPHEELWLRRRGLDEQLQHEERKLRNDMLSRVQKYEHDLRAEAEGRQCEQLRQLQAEIEDQRQAWTRELDATLRSRQMERDQWATERREYERDRREWELERERWLADRQRRQDEEAREAERKEHVWAEQEQMWALRLKELEDRHNALSIDIEHLLAEHARLVKRSREQTYRRGDDGRDDAAAAQLFEDHLRVWQDVKQAQVTRVEKERSEWQRDKGREADQLREESGQLYQAHLAFVSEREAFLKQRDSFRADVEESRRKHEAWLAQRDAERRALQAEREANLAERREAERKSLTEKRAVEEAMEAFAAECAAWSAQQEADRAQLNEERYRLQQQREKLAQKVKGLFGDDGWL